MIYGSVCSGIEAASVAWHPLGWTPAWFAEIEAFPCAVLAHHYPKVPNHGDFTQIDAGRSGAIDLLVGGTPCQAFSVAGKRAGLDDPRGNLTMEFLRLANRLKPRWIAWENVPGVLSIDSGRTFGAFIGTLGKLGYGFAYRVLDAQYFGVPQRRRRVFVVGYFGDHRPPAAVLFERDCLSGNPAPRRQAGETIAGSLEARSGAVGGGPGGGTDGAAGGYIQAFPIERGNQGSGGNIGHGELGDAAFCMNASQPHAVAHSLRAAGYNASEDGTGRGTPLVAAFQERAVSDSSTSGPSGKGWRNDGLSFTLEARSTVQSVAFQESESGTRESNIAGSMRASGPGFAPSGTSVRQGLAVRRLTPRECERLQGFPDDWTRIPWRGKPAEDCPDSPRYRALGNSMAVPVMRWIGERIQLVEGIIKDHAQ